MDPAFRLAPEAQAIAVRLIDDHEVLSDELGDTRVVCVLSDPVPVLRGAECAAFIAVPTVQGALHHLFEHFVVDLAAPVLEGEMPDYLVLLHAELWPTLNAVQQERLIFHELLHVKARRDEITGAVRRNHLGRVITRLIPHDYEVFDVELRRYGADVCGVQPLVAALASTPAVQKVPA